MADGAGRDQDGRNGMWSTGADVSIASKDGSESRLAEEKKTFTGELKHGSGLQGWQPKSTPVILPINRIDKAEDDGSRRF